MSRRTGLVASNLLIGALGLVSFGHNGWDVAAGLAVTVLGWHGGHIGGSRRGRLVILLREG